MGKVVINLTAGREDGEGATIAFLVATAAQTAGHDVLAFMTKDAVQLGFPGGPEAVPQQGGRPSFAKLFAQFAEAGGIVYLCPVCVSSRDLGDDPLPNATIAGATPMWAGLDRRRCNGIHVLSKTSPLCRRRRFG